MFDDPIEDGQITQKPLGNNFYYVTLFLSHQNLRVLSFTPEMYFNGKNV